jgi:hypothetical protein
LFAFKVALTLAIGSATTAWLAGKFNSPYPWNNPAFDYIEGLAVLIFLPSILTAVIQGVWLI